MRSIQRRLSLGLISVMVVVGLVLAQTSLWLFEMGLQRYLEAGLRNDSESLLAALVRGPQGLQLDERRLSPAYQRPFSGHYFRIDFTDGHWRSRSLWDQEMPALDHPGLHDDLQLGPEGQQLLVLRTDYRRLGLPISISVAEDYTPIRESFRRVQQLGLGLGLTGLLLILLLQRITVRRALRPLEQAREQIAQLQQGQRSQLDNQVPLELEPLVAQINHLLALLQLRDLLAGLFQRTQSAAHGNPLQQQNQQQPGQTQAQPELLHASEAFAYRRVILGDADGDR